MINKNNNPLDASLLEAHMCRRIIFSCLNLLSLYTNVLVHNKKHCTFSEKLTVNKLKKFIDLTLSNINRFSLKKRGVELVQKHTDNMETSTDFLIELLTLSEMLVDNPESRKRVISRFEHMVGEENKKFYNKNK